MAVLINFTLLTFSSRHVHPLVHLPADHFLLLHPRESVHHLDEVLSCLDHCLGFGFIGCHSPRDHEMSEETEDRRADCAIHCSVGCFDQHGRDGHLRMSDLPLLFRLH